MNVLSLFDGIGGSSIALENVGLKCNVFSSEVCHEAITIAENNYPENFRLGDINNWRDWDLPKIDLIIAGSPCQGFSRAGLQNGFLDERSKLFFEAVNVLNHYKPDYFLFENVLMNKYSEQIFNEKLNVEPIKINSNLVSAQNRKRNYWTNIDFELPSDRNIRLNDILESGCSIEEKSATLKAQYHKSSKANFIRKGTFHATGVCVAHKDNVLDRTDELIPHYENQRIEYMTLNENQYHVDEFSWRKLSPNECETLQNIPLNYTDGISNTKRYQKIGNGFTVDIVSQILREL